MGNFALSTAEIALDNDDVDAARGYLETQQRLASATQSDATRARILYVQARIAAHDGHDAQAQALLGRALPLLPEVTRWVPLRTRILTTRRRLAP